MIELRYAPASEFRRVMAAGLPPVAQATLFSALCRLNVLYMIKRAGSGHLGTSFSCQDIVSWIFLNEVKGEHDVSFSSKGHDVPAYYAALSGLGQLPFEKIHALRRLGGLPGHPEVIIHPKMEANTGSLGMGISKAKGMILARRLQGQTGRHFVLTGDGELDEGQIWEALPSAVNQRMGELTVIVDHNKIQSDTWVHRVSDLGNLEKKFTAFGWHVSRCDGNDMSALAKTFGALKDVKDQPKVIIADTIKGKGISFMEAFGPTDNFYGFHSGAPTDEQYTRGFEELSATATRCFQDAKVAPPVLETYRHDVPAPSPEPRHKLVEAYGREIVRHAERNPKIVALDADLIKDTGLTDFAARFPERVIECGIAEQDMVSQAGGLALKGMLPLAHSFSCFLSSRPNEQIYTNATERSKVIYVATLAGMLPATPGHSHQSVRDISALGAMPNLVMVAPATEPETAAALDWAINTSRESTYLRLSSIPCVIPFAVAPQPKLTLGQGTVYGDGRDLVLITYGPVLVSQAFLAAERLRAGGAAVKVISLPWLNRVDADWLRGAVDGAKWIFTVDDQYLKGGQGDLVLAALAERGWPPGARARRFGLSDVPECGHNDEVLKHHELDADGITAQVRRSVAS